jgi:hypothetical protein
LKNGFIHRRPVGEGEIAPEFVDDFRPIAFA